MAQKQLDLLGYQLNNDELLNVEFREKEVVCELNERFSIIVKRFRHSVQIFLRSGRRRVKLPMNILEAICNAQLSVTYLKHYLEEA